MPKQAKRAPSCKCGCGKQVTERYGVNGDGGWKAYFSSVCPRRKPSRQSDAKPASKHKSVLGNVQVADVGTTSSVAVSVNSAQLDGFWAKLAIADKAQMMMRWLTGVPA